MGYAAYEVRYESGLIRWAGYGVYAKCDRGDCLEQVSRGLDALCGRTPGGDEYGCGGYFCPEHVSILGQCEACAGVKPEPVALA